LIWEGKKKGKEGKGRKSTHIHFYFVVHALEAATLGGKGRGKKDCHLYLSLLLYSLVFAGVDPFRVRRQRDQKKKRGENLLRASRWFPSKEEKEKRTPLFSLLAVFYSLRAGYDQEEGKRGGGGKAPS